MFSANENIQLRQYKKRIVNWVEECIPDAVLDLGCSVMAMQVQCQAPGCVPLETCIVIVFPSSATELIPGLVESAGGNYKTKILKPMSAVIRQDVLEALPTQFEGGLRSMEKLCLQARDIMLGQITQLFDDSDVEGRRLMAGYLQASLQEYMDRDCEPPEWGEPFPEQKQESSSSKEKNADNNNSKEKPDALHTSGNIVIQRPLDDDDDVDSSIEKKESDESFKAKNNAVTTNATNNNSGGNTVYQRSASSIQYSSTTADAAAAAAATTNRPSVFSATRQRQQQQATRMLQSGNTFLSQLAQRDHAPGIRRPGCPCCDPDHPSNIVDQMMMS